MRDGVAERTVDWLSGVVDLMREAHTVMPVRSVFSMLGETFRFTALSWAWTDDDGSFGMIIEPSDVLLADREGLDRWLSGELLDCAALRTWFAVTRDPAPYTTERVPTRMVPRQRRILIDRPLARLGVEQQLGIVYQLDRTMYRAFLVARATLDFDDDDLVVAGYVQRSLRSLDQQCAALRKLTEGSGCLKMGSDLGLSGRELAVLQLVSDGHTTRMIGRRLGCAPRTVEKHLERSYRKLGVRDRLNAVRVARRAGVLGVVPRPQDHRFGPLEPGEFRGPT